jgi:hypothetical protein
VLSVLFVVCYLGLGLPSVGAGVLIVHGGGLIATVGDYTLFILVLAAASLAGLLSTNRSTSHLPAPTTATPNDDPHWGRASTPGLTFLAHLRRSAHPATHHTRPEPDRRNGPPGH